MEAAPVKSLPKIETPPPSPPAPPTPPTPPILIKQEIKPKIEPEIEPEVKSDSIQEPIKIKKIEMN